MATRSRSKNKKRHQSPSDRLTPQPTQRRSSSKRRKRAPNLNAAQRGKSTTPAAKKGPSKLAQALTISVRGRLIIAGVLLVAFIWSYVPTFAYLMNEWDRLPDYSHGWLVIPFACVLAYARRKSFPGWGQRLYLGGLSLMAASLGLRWFAAAYFYGTLDGLSILLWTAGLVWLIGGPRVLWWASPPIVFLGFMVPLPYSIGLMLSHPLQRIATIMSTWMLQLLGQPALSEGNTILLNQSVLEVEQACSGLRILVGILALGFFFVFVVNRTWWMKLIVMGAAIPIALFTNSLRIVATGLLVQYASGEVAKKFTHDLAGWVMIPLACLFFGLFLWYLSRLLPVVENVEMETVVQGQRDARRKNPRPATVR